MCAVRRIRSALEPLGFAASAVPASNAHRVSRALARKQPAMLWFFQRGDEHLGSEFTGLYFDPTDKRRAWVNILRIDL